MSGYERVADEAAESGADEAERERRAERPVDLEAVEARASAATLPPWTVSRRGARYSVRAPDSDEPICNIAEWGPKTDEADALFIAHAREDVPALVAENRRLREALAAYRATHDIGNLVVAQGRECMCDDCKRAKEVLGG